MNLRNKRFPTASSTATAPSFAARVVARLPFLMFFAGAGTLLAATSGAPLDPPAEGSALKIVIPMLFVFVLATVIGMEVIKNVSRLLHTPLMSLTNAISAIVIVGAILVAGPQLDAEHPLWIRILGLVAIAAASINIFSGFLITNRMLKMFKTRTQGKES